jgi:hypothetical protein
MKHASTRAMFQYWNACRGRHPAPERDEIDPAALRRVLADSLVLSVDRTAGHPVRLAGTRLCALFCRELKAEPFTNLWEPASRPLVEDLIGTVTGEAVGVVAGATGLAGEDPAALELLLLPLSVRGRLDVRLLGLLAPLQVPYWLGIHPVGTLRLGPFRHVGPSTESMPGRRLGATLQVIEGGRSGDMDKGRHGLPAAAQRYAADAQSGATEYSKP